MIYHIPLHSIIGSLQNSPGEADSKKDTICLNMHQWTVQGGTTPQQCASDKEVNFSLGQPSPRLLPIEAIAEAASRSLDPNGSDRLILQYGAAQGRFSTRESVSVFLSKRHQIAVDPSHLMISTGNSAALGLLCSALRRTHATAFIEDPSYLHAPNILKSHGIQAIRIPVDQEGLCLDTLEHLLCTNQSAPAFLYCIPTYHNPTGRTLSSSRRKRLLELATEHEFPIIADEPYNLLHFGPNAIPPLASEPNADWVISLGTFSKILGPGLRLGWIHASPRWIRLLVKHGELVSGGGLNPVVGTIVQQTIDSGFLDSHIDCIRKTLVHRSKILHQSLANTFWIGIPQSIDANTLLKAAKPLRVQFTPGSRCGPSSDNHTFMRLSFSFYEPEELVEGAERLVTALHTLLD